MNTITIDNFGFFDPEFDAKALALAKRMLAKYGNCELGRNRLVFSSKFAVLKIPTCAEGCQDNDWEGSICGGIARSKNYDVDNVHYPNTRWLEIDGFVCCMMEKVEPLEFKSYDEVPEWVGSVDCGQIGHSVISGRLVAYDYGLN